MAVGIDDMNVDGGTLAVETRTIAEARGFSERDLAAVEFDRRSVIPPWEDPVSLAVNAARPLVEAAGRDAFELVIVATESGIDYGKPLSSYVHHYLGLGSRCRNLEVKHACYAGTAAIQLATAWVRSNDAPGKKALIVMTDLARRHFEDPAELTAGSGAVAVTVAAEPQVFAIEPVSGYASREVYDVARPQSTGEWGDAVLSLAAYLDLVEEAWDGYRRAMKTTDTIDLHFRYLLYHTPLVSLVRDAHRLLLEADRDDVGPAFARDSFDRMVRPALRYARVLGNIYSGSVYALLAGLLDGEAEMGDDVPVGICSYGSGSCAEIFAGRIPAAARATVRRHCIGAHLAARTELTLEEYERIFRESESMHVASDYTPDAELMDRYREPGRAAVERLVLERIEKHHRIYGWSQ
jgi:polyketide biosynthesis 3-hydroxy-3-methylglutaryl-CoA synthase-like enzyme PksG